MTNTYLDKSYWNGMIKMSLSRLFILRILYERPLHGYEISKKIAALTDGCCAPTEGALYPALHEFAEEGYLNCKDEIVRGRKRKVYALTDKGLKACRIGLEAWEETAKTLLCSRRLMAESDSCCKLETVTKRKN